MTDTTTATGAFPMPGTRSDYRLFGALDGKPGLVAVGPSTRVVKEGEALRFADGTYVVRGDDLIAESAAAPREIGEADWLPLARDWVAEQIQESVVGSIHYAHALIAEIFINNACRERGL